LEAIAMDRPSEVGHAASLLAQDVPNFLRETIELAKAEARVAGRTAAARGGALYVLNVLFLVGLLFAASAASMGVSLALDKPWAGPLIVGSGLILLAAVALPLVLRRGSGAARQA
jgi:hypothetical protein